MVKKIRMEAVINRVQKMVELRETYMQEVDQLHVRLMQGNSKTGRNCFTVSLIPIADCCNCKECKGNCYDVKNVCYLSRVQNIHAINSAIHKADPERYWNEISLQIKANFVEELRINVGGDLTDEDFYYIDKLGRENPRCDIMFFTKNYVGIAKFLDEMSYTENVKPLLSAWPGTEMYNPHNLPVSHVLFADGTTTAPKYGSIYCGGNCSECHFNHEGCWNLQKGESVIFLEH